MARTALHFGVSRGWKESLASSRMRRVTRSAISAGHRKPGMTSSEFTCIAMTFGAESFRRRIVQQRLEFGEVGLMTGEAALFEWLVNNTTREFGARVTVCTGFCYRLAKKRWMR